MEAGSEPLTAVRSPGPPAPSSGALGRALPYALAAGVALAFVLSLPLAIGRADESHLLNEARRVAEGEAPYRDFFESLTPLSFYLFAALFLLGGTTLFAARAVIAGALAVAAALLWHLTRRVAGALEAALVVPLLIFVAVPTWPYASPHWLSTMLGLATAAVTLRAPRRSDRLRPFVAGLLAGAAVCTQQQRGVFLAIWLPLALLLLDDGPPPRPARRVRTLAWAAAGGALVIVGILGHAAWRASLPAMVEMLIGFAVSHYGPTHSGHNAWAVVLPFTQQYANATWLWLMRIAPLFIIAEAIGLVLQRRRPWPRRERERAALCLLAVLMAASVWYLPDVIHVAFVLPFLLIPGASALHRLHQSAPPQLAAMVRVVAVLLVVAGVAAAANKGLASRRLWQAAAPARLETAYGALQVDASLPQVFATVQEHLVREPDGRALFYSYPGDAWLYLALPADNPTPFSLLVPDMFPDEYFEQAAAVLRSRRPGTVMVLKLLLEKPQAQVVQRAVDAGYDLAAELDLYRIYVRRSDG